MIADKAYVVPKDEPAEPKKPSPNKQKKRKKPKSFAVGAGGKMARQIAEKKALIRKEKEFMGEKNWKENELIKRKAINKEKDKKFDEMLKKGEFNYVRPIRRKKPKSSTGKGFGEAGRSIKKSKSSTGKGFGEAGGKLHKFHAVDRVTATKRRKPKKK